MQAIDQMLDVRRRILRVLQARDRIFELAPVDDDRRVHREVIVLAGVIDMQVRMGDIANVTHFHAMSRELVLDHVLMILESAHPQRLHDLVGAKTRIHEHGMRAAENQESKGVDALRSSAILAEHEEACFQLDIAKVEDLDFQRHYVLPDVFVWLM